MSNVEQFLRDCDQEKLKDQGAWHNVFLDQVNNRIPEECSAGLFDEETGRPKAPIRLLVAMLVLKEGCSWSDEQLFEGIHLNLLVRRALGLFNLTDDVAAESTYYLFKQRLYGYQLAQGENLLHDVFQEPMRDQAKRLGVVGDKLRMDSTLLDSNLATSTRLQMIIGCLQAFYESLTDDQQASVDDADRASLERLCAKQVSQIIYGLDDVTKQTWLDDFGALLQRLHQTASLHSSPRYALIQRLLHEQYHIDGEGAEQHLALKPNAKITADSLQSPHDEDAAYRKKKNETVRGYSAKLTETCDAQLNLISDVQVESATTADNSYLIDAVQNSEAVLDGTAQEISADGAYYSDENETYANDRTKKIHYTGVPGKPGRYDYARSADGVVVIDRETGQRQLAEEYKPGR